VLFDLAPHVQQERAVGGVDHLHAVEPLDRVDDPLPVLLAGGVNDDVAQALAAVDLDQVNRADEAPGLADRRREHPEHAGRVVDLDAHRETVLGAGRAAHSEEVLGSGGRAC
jgi:hypothetical protein